MKNNRKARIAALSIAVLAGFLITSCHQQTATSDFETIKFTFEEKPQTLDFSTLIDTIYEPIVLETTDDCLIGEISKIAYSNDTIIIADEQTNSIFIFDGSGKFITKIHREGRGPEEYIELGDVFVCDHHILVLDNSRKVCCYNFKGKCLYHFDSIEGVYIAEHDGRIFIATNWGEGEDWNNCLIAEFDPAGNMVNTYFKQEEKDSERSGHIYNEFFIKTDNGLDVHLISKNIVYSLNGNNFEPNYKVDFGEYEMPDEITEKGSVYIMINGYTEIYTLGIMKLVENSRFRFISAYLIKKYDDQVLVYDKKERQTIGIYDAYFQADGTKLYFNQLYADGDFLTDYYSGEILSLRNENVWSQKPPKGLERKIQQAANNITVDDNGIIVKIKLRGM